MKQQLLGLLAITMLTKTGVSVFDPIFVLAAVWEWAGIASNERGELILTASYQEKLHATADKEMVNS